MLNTHTHTHIQPVLSFQGVLAALGLLQLGLHRHEFLPVALLLDAQHLVFALQAHNCLPVEGVRTGREKVEDRQMKRVRERLRDKQKLRSAELTKPSLGRRPGQMCSAAMCRCLGCQLHIEAINKL